MTDVAGYPYEIPSDFQLLQTEYKCAGCGKQFVCLTSPDNALVKFVNPYSSQERWLPTFEKGGYLDIVEQCVQGFQRDREITMKVFREFESKFQSFQHPPTTGGYWEVAKGCPCPSCSSDELDTLAERILSNPKVEWLAYDPIR